MSKTIVLLFFMFLGFDSVSNAKSDENISIQYLINQYAALNRANFILSPEVFGEVELSELKVEKIAKSDLKEIFSANLEIYFNLMESFMLKYPNKTFAIQGKLQEEYWESANVEILYGMFNGLLTARLFNLNVKRRFVKETIERTKNLINQLE